jgi:hypothetical protein
MIEAKVIIMEAKVMTMGATVITIIVEEMVMVNAS